MGKSEKGRDDFYFDGAGVRKGKWKFLDAEMKSSTYAEETGSAKTDRLFNLETDLGEKNNLAKEYPEVLSELKELYQKIKKSK